MWLLFLISLGFVFPAIAVKSLRAKFIYFINAFLVTWLLTSTILPYVKSIYSNSSVNIGTTEVLMLLFLMILAVLYFIYGLVKFILRFKEFGDVLDSKHTVSLKDHLFDKLNEEEKRALIFSWPGILIVFYLLVSLIYKI